ncbi:MAG: methyltransferase domain-containing protein [Pseudomonadota bacterium]
MSLTPYNCPMSERRADDLISRLAIDPSNMVLDAGCGSAEFLIRLLHASGCEGIGIDLDEEALDHAMQPAQALVETGRLRLLHADLKQFKIETARYAAGICLGSSHAFADEKQSFPVTLERLSTSVSSNGMILVGECFWRKEPHKEYLELLGEPVGIYRTFEENIICAEEIGLRLVDADQATLGEWDQFERDHLRRSEIKLSEAPDDEKLVNSLNAQREWYAGYEKWGRDTLGFGFYVFQKA